jgi:ABC-type Fe3+-hydroxamate transport system substrate-binding protein
MRAFALVVLLAAAPLGACSALSLAQSAPQSTSDAEKALTIAHLAYQAVGLALKDAAASGALHGADAATAQALYDKVGAALDAADAADEAANASGVLAAVADADTLIAQLHTLIAQR